jgi:3',5'-cyclic-AMP phosphodiesterase
MQYQFPAKSHYRLAQITDCHLLATADGWYQQVQPARHLRAIVECLARERPDAVLLTGDVTQDHSAASYQLLAQLLAPLNCPIFCLPGNHDDPAELAQLSRVAPFNPARSLLLASWQIVLLNTKGNTPAGVFLRAEQQWLQQQCQLSQAERIWLFCHHHPWPLNCFIDKHGQQHRDRLWQSIAGESRIRGIGHGHAHYAYQRTQQAITVVGCPASSVQFLATPDWQTVNGGPQWCDWVFASDGEVNWTFRQLEL